ncbi:MAG: hypothetical protein SOZ52_00675 [Pyramidobacter sp.]|nr:hypothetical protein [Pyramidobacter sp.]
MDRMVTPEQAVAIMAERGIHFDLIGLRKKAREGKIPGAQKVGGARGIWLIPREWAQSYEKIKSGRPRVKK